MTYRLVMLVTAIAAFAATQVYAQPYVYPAKGQSAEQQKKDEYACYDWAKQQSGFDPMQAGSQPAAAPPPEKKGGRLRGGARGALGGAVIGGIAGDAGKGAAIGATAGVVVGGARQRQENEQQQAATQQQQAVTAESQQSYQRAYGACLEGRGYTVK